MSGALTLRPGALTLAALRCLWSAPVAIAVDADARSAVVATAGEVSRVVAAGDTVYG